MHVLLTINSISDAFMMNSLVLHRKQVAQLYLNKAFMISVKHANMITVFNTAKVFLLSHKGNVAREF